MKISEVAKMTNGTSTPTALTSKNKGRKGEQEEGRPNADLRKSKSCFQNPSDFKEIWWIRRRKQQFFWQLQDKCQKVNCIRKLFSPCTVQRDEQIHKQAKMLMFRDLNYSPSLRALLIQRKRWTRLAINEFSAGTTKLTHRTLKLQTTEEIRNTSTSLSSNSNIFHSRSARDRSDDQSVCRNVKPPTQLTWQTCCHILRQLTTETKPTHCRRWCSSHHFLLWKKPEVSSGHLSSHSANGFQSKGRQEQPAEPPAAAFTQKLPFPASEKSKLKCYRPEAKISNDDLSTLSPRNS